MPLAVRRMVVGFLLGLLVLQSGCSAFDSRPKYRDPLAELDDDAKPDSSLNDLSDTFKAMAGLGPDAKKASQLFADGQAKYAEALGLRQSDPDAARSALLAAAAKFEDAAARLPESAVEENSLYLLGESHFFVDQYDAAEQAYAQLVKQHPRTRYLDLAQARRFAIAQFWLSWDDNDPQSVLAMNLTDDSRPLRDTFGHSVRVFDRIRLDDPTGKLADDATLALGNAFFARQDFARADEYYTDLRRTFPGSEHQFRAHFLGLKSKVESYQGVEYSAKPLDEAEKIVKQIQRQFPVEAQQERDYLARAAAEIQFRKAEREWHRAQRHDRRAEYGAARMYYVNLVDNYARTAFAERAAERLQAIGGRPDIPPQPMEWLVEIFPEKDSVQPLIATQSDSQRR